MFRGMGTAGYAVLAVVVVGGGLGLAVAQEAAESTVDVVKVEPMGASAEQETLSPAAQAKAAEGAVANATASCTAQSQALKSAKREKDIIRATCLDDKLSQCNANLQNIRRRETALNEAIADGGERQDLAVQYPREHTDRADDLGECRSIAEGSEHEKVHQQTDQRCHRQRNDDSGRGDS